MFSNATHWVSTLENLRNMWIENDSFDALNSLRNQAGEIAYILASASDTQDIGVAGILLREKAKRDQVLLDQGQQPDSKPENILELGKSVQYDDENLAYSPIVKYFEEALKKYSFQKQTMTAIPARWVINNILIDTSYLKSVLEPSPDRCFNNVAKLLPGIARDKNELLLTEVQTWVRVLNTEPQNVEGFVEYLGWLEKVVSSLQTVDLIENEVSNLYSILDQYKIYIQPTDLAMFQTLGPTLRNLKEAVDYAMDSKEEKIAKFSNDQDKTLQELMVEVSDIRNKTQDPMVLNPNSAFEVVLKYLDDLSAHLSRAEASKKTYEAWGELFRNGGVQVDKNVQNEDSESAVSAHVIQSTRDADLAETKKEIELKRTLWVSLRDWELITAEWKTINFDTLNHDDVSTKISAFMKTVYTLDKGLPPNEVVPKLKQMVNDYRDIYPTIVDLRNPALKSRHWEKIQDAMGKIILKDETFTLGKLIEIRVFDFKVLKTSLY